MTEKKKRPPDGTKFGIVVEDEKGSRWTESYDARTCSMFAGLDLEFVADADDARAWGEACIAYFNDSIPRRGAGPGGRRKLVDVVFPLPDVP